MEELELDNNTIKMILQNNIENNKLNAKQIQERLQKYFKIKAILGFDIYKYGKFPIVEQTLIPYLFKTLYEGTIKNCLNQEIIIFQNFKRKNFAKNFIDTGDGGFQIFDNPMEAVIFAIYFQANIQRFNSGFIDSLVYLRELTGEITLRYSLTYDTIYRYNNNLYGTALINNARIISKDKLNRFLIDENTFDWFRREINGIESLLVINQSDFEYMKFMKGTNFTEKGTYLFNKDISRFLNVASLKIGEIQSKQELFSIYNIYIQTFMSSPGKRLRKITVSVGNLYSSGIL